MCLFTVVIVEYKDHQCEKNKESLCWVSSYRITRVSLHGRIEVLKEKTIIQGKLIKIYSRRIEQITGNNPVVWSMEYKASQTVNSSYVTLKLGNWNNLTEEEVFNVHLGHGTSLWFVAGCISAWVYCLTKALIGCLEDDPKRGVGQVWA